MNNNAFLNGFFQELDGLEGLDKEALLGRVLGRASFRKKQLAKTFKQTPEQKLQSKGDALVREWMEKTPAGAKPNAA